MHSFLPNNLTFVAVRWKGRKRETEQHSFAAERTVEDGKINPVLDEDRLVSETKRAQEEQNQVSNEDMDARVEQMLHDAYADARKFAKFPNMP